MYGPIIVIIPYHPDLTIFTYYYRFVSELNPLPEIPEMTFDRNTLKITHEEGFGLDFSALDALRLVDAKNDLMKVAVSDEWRASRSVLYSI